MTTIEQLAEQFDRSRRSPCRKCASTAIVVEFRSRFGKERLEHRCAECGYKWDEPCKDAAGQPEERKP